RRGSGTFAAGDGAWARKFGAGATGTGEGWAGVFGVKPWPTGIGLGMAACARAVADGSKRPGPVPAAFTAAAGRMRPAPGQAGATAATGSWAAVAGGGSSRVKG